MYVIKNRGFALIFFCLVLGISGLSHADNVFFDDFNSNANEWLIEENNPNGLLSISNGFYYFANYVDSGSMMTIQEILIDQTRDFEVETQITKNGGDETLPYFGLTWTDNNTNNYLDFGIDGFGWFSIYMVVDGTGTNIVEWTESPYLNQGIGGINKLSIKKTDNTIEFYINDNVVHSMAAVTLAGDHIGFFIDGAQDIAIDYLYVTQDGSSNSSATCETVPGAVSLTAPTGTTTDTSPTLTWNSDSCATWYKVYLVNTATDYKFVQWYEIENNFTNYPEATCSGGTCSVTPGVTLASGNYEWWVRTWNENGNGAWSSTGSFTVQGDDTLPAKIYLTSPSGNINGLGTTFTWNQDADATWYKLYLASSTGYKFVQWYEINDNSAGYPEATCTGGDCSVTVNETFPDGSHDWYVRGWNDTGNGDWSDGMSFTVKSSEMEKDINEVIGMITSVEDLSPMIEEIGTLLGEVLSEEGSSIVTITPPIDMENPLELLSNPPPSITISADLGNGYTPEGSTSVLTGSMLIKVTDLLLSQTGITADVSLLADDIRRDGKLILDGGMTLSVVIGPSGANFSATASVGFDNLKSLDFQVNGDISLVIPSISMEGELIGSQPITISFQQFATLDYQISGDIDLSPDGDVYDIDFDLDTNQGDVAGTVRVDGTNPDRIIISTPGSTLKAGDYTLDINNVVMASDVCTDSPSSGNIVVTDNLETKTITFNNNCDYTIN